MRISDWSSDVCSSDLLAKSALARDFRHTDPRDAKIVLVEAASGLLGGFRSEEHTSELQSLMRISYAVFCLKKKKNITNTTNYKNQLERLLQQTTHKQTYNDPN